MTDVTPAEAEGWFKVAIAICGALAGTFGTWVLMKRDIADIKEVVKGGPDDWSIPEMRRQLKAAWAEIEKVKDKARELELADAAGVSELKGYVNAQKDRIDLHAKRTEAGQVKNAEFFAEEARAALARAEEIEARIKAHDQGRPGA